jgi:hypothetical protein
MSQITRLVLQLAAIYMAAAAVWLGIKLPVLATIFLLGLAWFLVSKWRSQTHRINASIAALPDESVGRHQKDGRTHLQKSAVGRKNKDQNATAFPRAPE